MALPTPENESTIDAPDSITEQAEGFTPLPVAKTPVADTPPPVPTLFTPKDVNPVEPPFPLNHARILYENIMQTYASLAASANTGTAINAVVPNTASAWSFLQAGASAIWQIDFAATVKVFDTFCIGAHNLSSVGATVTVNYITTAGGTLLFDEIEPQSNDPIMLHRQSSVNCRGLQIIVSGGDGDIEIGYMSAGVALQMQRPFFNGHTPITDADVTTYYRAKTESGNIVGRSIRRLGYETSYSWNNIDDGWYRTYIPEFKQSAKLSPVFIAWNLQEYPDDIGFGFIEEDIRASYNGIRNLRSMNFTLLGY